MPWGLGGLLGLALDLLDQPQGDPAHVAGVHPRAAARRRGRWRRLAHGLRAHGGTHVAPVEADLHRAVAERGVHLRGELGERLDQGEPGGRFDGGAEQCGRALGLLVAGCGRSREVVTQLRDISTDVHDATVASSVVSVKRRDGVIPVGVPTPGTGWRRG